MNNRNALIIIAKYPAKENVMTRLKGSMPDDKRLELCTSLLKKTVFTLRSTPSVDTFIAFAPLHSEEYFSRFGVKLIALPAGGDLGLRMCHAFEEVFEKGYDRAVLVGTDIPDLSDTIIKRAFDILSQHDIVFGPAKDGGYYLIGMKRLIREVFEGVVWSSDETLGMSLEIAGHCGHSVAFTDTLSDIDTVEDLEKAGLEFRETGGHT